MSANRVGIVYWHDAEIVRREPPPDKCPLMQSIGYVEKFKDRVVVFHLFTPDKDVSNMVHTTIPIGCVHEIKYLREVQR